MNTKWNEARNMVLLSLAFTMVLLAVRVVITGQLMYVFYIWNLFLAAVPIFFSCQLYKFKRISFGAGFLLFLWLLFFPNAPYIITDIFHFTERKPVPKWFDLLLVTSATWNGLILGIVSLMQVEKFLLNHLVAKKVNVIISFSLLLSAFGIYLGRFLRFNSWDVFTNPQKLLSELSFRIFYPHHHLKTWAFTFMFGAMLWLIYHTIKRLSSLSVTAK